MFQKSVAVALLLFLCIAYAGAGENAKVLRIFGKAEILQHGESNALQAGQDLSPGMGIAVADGGEALIEAGDGAITVTAKGGTILAFDGVVDKNELPWKSSRLAGEGAMPAAGGEPTVQFNVNEGEIDVQVITGQSLRIVTPVITAAVRGTEFTTTVQRDGSAEVLLDEGWVDALRRDGVNIPLLVGQQNSVSYGSREYVLFLEKNGFIEPGQYESVRDIPETILEQIDSRVIGQLEQIAAIASSPDVNPVTNGGGGSGGYVAPALYVPTLDSMISYELAEFRAQASDSPWEDFGYTPMDDYRITVPTITSGIVAGSLSSINPSLNINGAFGFDVTLDNGDISNAWIQGDGYYEAMASNHYYFDFIGGSGSATYNMDTDRFDTTLDNFTPQGATLAGSNMEVTIEGQNYDNIGDVTNGSFLYDPNDSSGLVIYGEMTGTRIE